MPAALPIGLQLPEVERVVPWVEYVAIARTAEAAGFDSLWVGDHLLYRGDGREERGPWDAWTVLAALAVATERVRLGPLVACTAFAPPGLLARRAAAVDAVSGGRLVLAIGAGWNEAEFHAFGLPYDRRASRFLEAFDIARRLLDGERVSVDSEFTHMHGAVLLPPPTRRPPLVVGSTGERVLRGTLAHADGWNGWYEWFDNSPDGFAAHTARVSRIAADVGRDPATLSRSAAVFVAPYGGAGDRPHAKVAPVTGSATAIAARLREFATAGADEVILVVDPITTDTVADLADVVAAVHA